MWSLLKVILIMKLLSVTTPYVYVHDAHIEVSFWKDGSLAEWLYN